MFPIFWYEPLRHLSVEWTHVESLWMCGEEFLPEHRKRREHLPLLTLMWLNHEEILIRMICYPSRITESLYLLITGLSTRTIGPIEIDGIYRVFFYEFFYCILRIATMHREGSSRETELLIDILKTFSDKSEPYISFTKILDRTSIMDKNRKNFHGILHGFYESCIIMSSEVLTEDEESSRIFWHILLFYLIAYPLDHPMKPQEKKYSYRVSTYHSNTKYEHSS